MKKLLVCAVQRQNRDSFCNSRSANGGITKTKILYPVFPTYAQVKEYVKMLVESNLLSFDLENQAFKITEKGHKFQQVSQGCRSSESNTCSIQIEFRF